jgi:glycosyltransferase involved in cell wall biosynthesis
MIYAGVFYRKLRDPGALFSAVTALAEKTQLDIFTGSSKFRVSSPRVVFHKPLPYAEILQKYQEYDVLVFLDNAYGIQTSGKIYELIAAKRPILFIYENEHSPTKKLVDDYRGVVFAKNDPAAIMGAIEQIRERYAEFSFDFPIEEHSWESRGEQYRKVIAKTTGAGGDHDQ